MGAVVQSYRPTADAIARHGARLGTRMPREIHVHASGRAVALYAPASGRGDEHYRSLFGLLDAHGLGTADVEGIV
jgi:hypothetical protein